MKISIKYIFIVFIYLDDENLNKFMILNIIFLILNNILYCIYFLSKKYFFFKKKDK